MSNYQQVRSLPNFRLFTVFFAVPGALLVLLGGYGLFGRTVGSWFELHHHARPTPA